MTISPKTSARGGEAAADQGAPGLPPGAPTPDALRPGAGAAPAGGARVWRVELPARIRLLNSNQRVHWRRRAERTREIRAAAATMTRAAGVPALRRAHIEAVYEPPDRRRRDPANLYPSFKAAVDGVVDAGVLPDDDAQHLVGPDMRLGEVHPGGRLVLVITELEST